VNTLDWLNLLIRWTHFVAGIAWIGSSLYFIWLDSHLERPAREGLADREVEGSLWMVHSGGFYRVEKRVIGPGRMPATLHWFKWEAAITWISGLFLLGVVYYSTRGVYLIDPEVARIGTMRAVLLGLGAVALSWIAYDAIWQSPLRRRPGLATLLCLLLLAGMTWILCQWMSGRAAFIHVGAALGTIMVANVWERILPAQRRMIDATARGDAPDLGEGLNAKTRSVHNSYMTFPVLILMLSHHFPAVYAHPMNALLLALLIIVGGGARHLMIGRAPEKYWAIVPLAAALIALVLLTARGSSAWTPAAAAAIATRPAPPYGAVKGVIVSRCLMCHSRTPPDDSFGPMPGGVAFDTDAEIEGLARRIYVRAALTRTMPLGNRTGITAEERDLIARWYLDGAPVD
jgi:uncharacterized membrane protein